jgi:hypothetical protein
MAAAAQIRPRLLPLSGHRAAGEEDDHYRTANAFPSSRRALFLSSGGYRLPPPIGLHRDSLRSSLGGEHFHPARPPPSQGFRPLSFGTSAAAAGTATSSPSPALTAALIAFGRGPAPAPAAIASPSGDRYAIGPPSGLGSAAPPFLAAIARGEAAAAAEAASGGPTAEVQGDPPSAALGGPLHLRLGGDHSRSRVPATPPSTKRRRASSEETPAVLHSPPRVRRRGRCAAPKVPAAEGSKEPESVRPRAEGEGGAGLTHVFGGLWTSPTRPHRSSAPSLLSPADLARRLRDWRQRTNDGTSAQPWDMQELRDMLGEVVDVLEEKAESRPA